MGEGGRGKGRGGAERRKGGCGKMEGLSVSRSSGCEGGRDAVRGSLGILETGHSQGRQPHRRDKNRYSNNIKLPLKSSEARSSAAVCLKPTKESMEGFRSYPSN